MYILEEINIGVFSYFPRLFMRGLGKIILSEYSCSKPRFQAFKSPIVSICNDNRLSEIVCFAPEKTRSASEDIAEIEKNVNCHRR